MHVPNEGPVPRAARQLCGVWQVPLFENAPGQGGKFVGGRLDRVDAVYGYSLTVS
jgi:hypothetical protein